MDTLAKSECDKYERMWKHKSYRKASPGFRNAPFAFSELCMKSGDSLVDFGCGSGKSTRWFMDRGLSVLGIDFAHNCLNNDNRHVVPFLKECLWSLPSMSATWGYCCDVMEHIPEERVDVVLQSIRRISERGAFFSISYIPDTMGQLIGETLHVTLKSQQWWHSRLEQHWLDVECHHSEHFVCR